MLPVESPFKLFTDQDGQPLDGGAIYFGQANQNPVTHPITVYWDAAGTIPAEQPLRTVNGYIYRSGTPASVFVDGAYSELVQDKKGRQVFYARTSDDFSIATVVRNFISGLAASVGAALIGFMQAGAGAVVRDLLLKGRDTVNAKDFGAVGDGVTDDTLALQRMINFISLPDSPKEGVIPNGAVGVFLITAPLQIATGGITLRWENSTVRIKKGFNGDAIIIRAGVVNLVNPGIDGNGGAGFTGGGVRFGPASQFTFDCLLDNPRIFGTKDSCLLFEGPRGGAGITVRGGSLITHNPSGESSGGYPSARVVGAGDTEPSARKFIGVTSSAQPLLDFTGMANTKVSNCFTGTFFFKGNPDVTGVDTPYGSCSEVYINNTYIRDGMTISGLEVMVDNCLTHGAAPIYAGAYGSPPTSDAAYGWCMTADTIACRMGATNVVSLGILDQSPNGHAIENQCSSFGYGKAMVTGWTASTTDPDIGNGTMLSIYDVEYKTINFRLRITTGTTTDRGVGRWAFDLPLQVSLYAPPIGLWTMVRPGYPTLFGVVLLTETGSIHRVSLADGVSDSGYIDDAYPANLPAGTVLSIDFSYSRG